MTDLATTLTHTFQQHFGAAPAFIVRAPGRVNLIGEHTDYNDGFVLPLAIDRAVWLALRPRDDDTVHIISLDFDAPVHFDLNTMTRAAESPAEYVKGVAWALRGAGCALRGFEAVMQGDVPIGAGLSSSAALELAIARSFASVSGLAWDAPHMARLAQKAENEWVGVNCGIMDQMIAATGRAGFAMLIDCRTLALTPAPLPAGVAVVVLDTGTRRGLVDSAYNERRRQCEAAARFFGVAALRDVTLAQFQAQAHALDDLTRRRARHVISENERTLTAARVMQAGEVAALGALMNASHDSLRDDFEVSSPALNAIVDIARQQPGCYGARMTGAGFGGCAVALVAADAAATFATATASAYQTATGHTPAVYICHASDGAAVLAGG
ncbi:MAG: galactokinase [Anaerolineae bacterium]|jgi:galactokinase|nr:galactokinase [Anaerolineae bacterium]